jgi:DmsE family decaheme c-type cytochrome
MRMRRLLSSMACLMLLTGFAGTGLMRAAGPGQQNATVSQGKPAVSSAEFVGQDTCATCHQDAVKDFGTTNPHSRLALEHSGKGITCESCHGPGQAHVEGGGDVTKIRRFDKMTAKQVDESCLTCHAGAHQNFERSAHAENGVSCTSCHSVHKSESPEHLLKAEQPKLCFQCHTDIKPAFAQPFHHRVDEGLMSCSDCHDPHGTFKAQNLKSTADQNAICTKCHSETAGPFAYEHPVVKTEGCVSCHSPHGSPNPRLLNVQNVNTLCLQCHSATNTTAFPHAVSPTGPVHNQAAQYVACTNCHPAIHGSNTSNIYFK